MKRKKHTIFSLFLLLLFFLNINSEITFPSLIKDEKEVISIFLQAKECFKRGELDKCYKNLMLIKKWKDDEEYRYLTFLTLIGLNAPFDAANFLKEYKISSAEENLLNLLVERECLKLSPSFENSKKIPLNKKSFKKIKSVAVNGETAYILNKNGLYCSNDGFKTFRVVALGNGIEILVGKDGKNVVLFTDSIFVDGKKIFLPLEILNPISFAFAPQGGFYVLSESGSVFLLDEEGRLIEERKLLLESPKKIRTDALFRVYILSQDNIYLYDASFNPVKTFSEKLRVYGARGITDFYVDFFGNILILRRSGEVLFFTFFEDLLGTFSNEKSKIKKFFFSGGKHFYAVDKDLNLMEIRL